MEAEEERCYVVQLGRPEVVRCQSDVIIVTKRWKKSASHFLHRAKGRKRHGEFALGVCEQYMSVEREQGKRGKEREEKKSKWAKSSRFDVGVFLTAIILQPTEFHQHEFVLKLSPRASALSSPPHWQVDLLVLKFVRITRHSWQTVRVSEQRVPPGPGAHHALL